MVEIVENAVETGSELMTEEQIKCCMDAIKQFQVDTFCAGLATGLNVGLGVGIIASAVTCGVTALVLRRRKKNQEQSEQD